MKINDRKVKGYFERPSLADESGNMVGVAFIQRGRTVQQRYEVFFYHRFHNEYGRLRPASVFPYDEKHLPEALSKFTESAEFYLRWGLTA